jgi:membrane protease YdiL (CAAX protease family)
LSSSLLLFGIPSVYFLGIAYIGIPFLTAEFHCHPAMAWFIGGSMVFVPLFMAAIMLARKDGYGTIPELTERFRLKRLSKRDWKYVFGSMIAIGVATGAIVGIDQVLYRLFGLPSLETTPSFMQFEPFAPSERWMLSVWAIMFFFNIFGEELLWRGYILPRQELVVKNKAWIANASLWMMFHLCFGVSLMIILLPIILVLPYAVQKTGNTNVGILIHALLNGPSFMMISLGIIR